MNRKPLKDLLKEKLSRERLSDREYARLENLMRHPPGNRVPAYNRLGRGIALAACLILIIGYFIQPSRENQPVSARTQNVDANPPDRNEFTAVNPSALRIAEEVLTNHILIRQLDIETNSLKEVRDSFEHLDFAVLASSRLPYEQLTLIGARYCTLQGFIATQLLLQTPEGGKVTHYQASYDETRFGPLPDIGLQQPPIILAERGYTVEIWREAGLVMAKAQAL